MTNNLRVFWQLLKVDLLTIKTNIFNKIINSFIWASSTIAISSYAMPLFGTDTAYGPFIAAGVVIGCGGFEMYSQTANFIADLEGDRHINYQLTLPLDSSWLFAKMLCNYTINSLILCIAALGTAKIILFTRLSILDINFLYLGVSLVTSCVFYGVFTLLITSFTPNLISLEHTFMRIIYPLWIFGCFQFSWYGLYNLSHTLGYICLFNPFTYTTESIRVAMLGQPAGINFCISIGVLIVSSCIFYLWAIARLKKRLDFV